MDAQTGRSPTLDRTMRFYVRASTYAPSVENFVLEAYCAWILGDNRRSQIALDRADELIRSVGGDPGGLGRLIAALRYAVNSQV